MPSEGILFIKTCAFLNCCDLLITFLSHCYPKELRVAYLFPFILSSQQFCKVALADTMWLAQGHIVYDIS